MESDANSENTTTRMDESDANSENTTTRMDSSSAGKRIGAKENESITGHIWAAAFQHVMACSRLAGIFKLKASYFLNFQIFFRPQ
jgi:hypothetical protein